jgi:peptide/nickel transport system substrate-binding protein
MALVTLALTAGCSISSGRKTERKVVVRTFPTLRVEIGAGADSLDPGISYSPDIWQSLWNVYLSPYGYAHSSGKAGTQIVPVLADGMPSISSGGRVYEFRLRKGLRYSNGKPVYAGDFAYAIRRLYLLDSVGAPLFDDIAGATTTAARRGGISGIETNDAARTITIHLKKPSASFLDALASLFAAPVPRSTPARDRTSRPIPSTGPYRITQVKWPEEFTLVRNRYFRPTETVPRTNPDRIVVSIVTGTRRALDRLETGEADYTDIPIELAPLQKDEAKGLVRLRTHIDPDIHYFFLNTTLKPFDDVRVRRAVNYAIDRERLVKIFGGSGLATENLFPPLYPSYRRHDLYPYDLAKARALIRQAGAKGMSVTIYGPTRAAAVAAAEEYVRKQLRAIGLAPTAKPRLLPPARYWTAIGESRSHVQIGYAFWNQSLPDPLTWFQSLLGSDQTGQTANTNYSFADLAKVDTAVASLAQEPELTDSVDARWAALDRQAMRLAPLAPFMNTRSTDVFSPRVDLRCRESSPVYGVDYGRLCQEPGAGTP